jgi:hypothetical protein
MYSYIDLKRFKRYDYEKYLLLRNKKKIDEGAMTRVNTHKHSTTHKEY